MVSALSNYPCTYNIRGSVASRMNASSVHVTRDQPIGRRPIQRCFGCSIVSTRHTLYFKLKDKSYNWYDLYVFLLNFIFSCKIHKTFLDCRRLLSSHLYWFIINISPRKNLLFTFHHRYEILDIVIYWENYFNFLIRYNKIEEFVTKGIETNLFLTIFKLILWIIYVWKNCILCIG